MKIVLDSILEQSNNRNIIKKCARNGNKLINKRLKLNSLNYYNSVSINLVSGRLEFDSGSVLL